MIRKWFILLYIQLVWQKYFSLKTHHPLSNQQNGIHSTQLLHRSDVTSVCCCCALLMFVNKKLHCHKIADKDNTHTVCRGTLTDREADREDAAAQVHQDSQVHGPRGPGQGDSHLRRGQGRGDLMMTSRNDLMTCHGVVTSWAGGPGGPAGGGHGGGGAVPPLRGAAGEHGHLVRSQENCSHQVDRYTFFS